MSCRKINWFAGIFDRSSNVKVLASVGFLMASELMSWVCNTRSATLIFRPFAIHLNTTKKFRILSKAVLFEVQESLECKDWTFLRSFSITLYYYWEGFFYQIRFLIFSAQPRRKTKISLFLLFGFKSKERKHKVQKKRFTQT